MDGERISPPYGNVQLYMAPPGTPLAATVAAAAPPSPHYLRSPIPGYIVASPDWRAPYLRVGDPALAVGYLTPSPPPPLPAAKPPGVSSPQMTQGGGIPLAFSSTLTDHGDGQGITTDPTNVHGYYIASAPADQQQREIIVLRAKDILHQLIIESDTSTAAEVFKAGLELLGVPVMHGNNTPPTTSPASSNNAAVPADSLNGFSGVKLVHPDEFRNPSTFLKIYGDPLCFSKLGPLPKKDRNGNWECHECGNVNFPRRFRCNMCQKPRGPEGDQLVNEYAIQVYEKYLSLFKQQKAEETEVIVPPTKPSRGGRRNGKRGAEGTFVPARHGDRKSSLDHVPAPFIGVDSSSRGDSENDCIPRKAVVAPQSSFY